MLVLFDWIRTKQYTCIVSCTYISLISEQICTSAYSKLVASKYIQNKYCTQGYFRPVFFCPSTLAHGLAPS